MGSRNCFIGDDFEAILISYLVTFFKSSNAVMNGIGVSLSEPSYGLLNRTAIPKTIQILKQHRIKAVVPVFMLCRWTATTLIADIRPKKMAKIHFPSVLPT